MKEFSIETGLLKQSFALCLSVFDKRIDNARKIDNTVIFSATDKDFLTMKAINTKNGYIVEVANIAAKIDEIGEFAWSNSKADVLSKLLKSYEGADVNFVRDDQLLKWREEYQKKIVEKIEVKKKAKKNGKSKSNEESKEFEEKITFETATRDKLTLPVCWDIDEDFYNQYFSADEGEELFKIDGDILSQMLQSISYHAGKSKDEDRFNEILFKVDENKLKMYSGSSFTLKVIEQELHAANCEFALKATSLPFIKKFLDGRMSDDLIEVRKIDGKIKFTQKSFADVSITIPEKKAVFSEKLISGIMTAEPVGNIKIISSATLKSLQKMVTNGIIFSEDSGLHITAENKLLKLQGFSINIGEFSSNFVVTETSGKIDFLISAKYFSEILSSTSANESTIILRHNQLSINTANEKILLSYHRSSETLKGTNMRQRKLYAEKTSKVNQLNDSIITANYAIKYAVDNEKELLNDFIRQCEMYEILKPNQPRLESEIKTFEEIKKQFDSSMDAATDTTISAPLNSKTTITMTISEAKAQFEKDFSAEIGKRTHELNQIAYIEKGLNLDEIGAENRKKLLKYFPNYAPLNLITRDNAQAAFDYFNSFFDEKSISEVKEKISDSIRQLIKDTEAHYDKLIQAAA